ncbi:ATP-binding protein [Streptomyces sp. M19]
MASTIVVAMIYSQNRQGIIRLSDAIPRGGHAPEYTTPRSRRFRPHRRARRAGARRRAAGLLVQSVIAFLLLSAVAGLLGWWLTGRVLRRVHHMTAQAKRISTANLHQRIALQGPEDEIKELSDTFDQLLARLDEAFHAQGRFIANASHELRTPLTLARTAIQVGLSSADPDRIPQIKEELLRANDRCVALINGLLELARGEQGLHQRDPVRLDTVARQTVREIDPRGVDIRLHAHPCEVTGDPLLLGQLVRNLVDNAVRYNAPGGQVTVRVGRRERPGRATPGAAWGGLTVDNTGPHVPADQVDALFEPFRRGTVERTGRSEGSGLGLSIVRAIVTAHGGHVHAAPRRSGGLSVAVTVPAPVPQPA